MQRFKKILLVLNPESEEFTALGRAVALARVGISGLFIGNTAERALDHVDCDSLTIKPKGFVTPVRLSDED